MRDNSANPVTRGLLVVAPLVALACVTGAVAWQLAQPPLPGLERTDPMTNQFAAVVDLITRFGMIATFGFLLAAVLHSPVKRSHHALSDRGVRMIDAAVWASRVWLLGAVLMVPLTAARNSGVDLATALAALGPFIAATQAAGAWFVPAFVALMLSLLGRRIRSTGPVAFALLFGVVWSLAPVVTGNVSVGADHDFGTDGAMYAAAAATIWAAGAYAALFADRAHTGTPGWGRRYRWFLVAAPFALLGWALVGWYEMAGTSWAQGYGLVTLASLAIWLILAVRAAITALRGGPRTPVTVQIDLALLTLAIGLRVALDHMYPPRFTAPQPSAQINYLGYELPNPPTLAELIGPGRPNVLLVVLSVLAIVGYLVAYALVRRRGIPWSGIRLASWLIGWVIVFWLATAGIWSFSGVAFSYHMVVHMTVSMIAPLFMVIGAPLTLALRVLPGATSDDNGGPRELILGLLAWKPLGILMHPIIVGMNFVASLYVLYFSDLFGYLMRFHWGHQLMTLHFLITGLLFFGLLIGSDRMPHELPHIAKLGMLFAAMPFHAFFAVILMQSNDIIGGNYFNALDVPWITDRLADQDIGGQVTWATGEIPMLVVVVALVAQWFAQDQREAKRVDRAMDEDLDHAHDAYNEMLRRLNERSERMPK